ncbi:MAG: lipoyl(octanoyl) transferase LipB [Bacteroidetes bacterium]|nr:lipoyl(octanoyl) transferase LipB [Bacteroidota bacterium]
MSINVNFRDLGSIDYQEAWDLQEDIFAETIRRKIAFRKGEKVEKTENTVLFCEHPHVYTLGKSGHPENLLLDEKALKEVEATYYKINRGGDITYHGPGQLVVYPILDLDYFFTDIHKYLRFLEEAVILTLADFGIKGERYEGLTGVWIDPSGENPRKICALGVKCSRWVTMHGIGFNVNTDLKYFQHIVPCGIDDKAVTSMQLELGQKVDFDKVLTTLKNHLADLFGFQWI